MHKRIAQEHQPVGLDDHEAWDYVARLLCPPTRPGQSPREELAKALLCSMTGSARDDALQARAARLLMGTAWAELFIRGEKARP